MFIRGILLRLIPTLLLLASTTSFAQRGAIVRPQNLAQITSQAAQVIRGRITLVRVEPHPQYKHLNSVVITVAVAETLKGTASDTVTFRQFLWDPRDVRDAANYHRGQEVVLFLNRVSDIGFTSPVGIDQGRFRIELDANGNRVAVNAHSNITLMEGMSQLSSTTALSARSRRAVVEVEQAGGPIPVDVLSETVRTLVRQAGGTR